jgi:hypothetical protein
MSSFIVKRKKRTSSPLEFKGKKIARRIRSMLFLLTKTPIGLVLLYDFMNAISIRIHRALFLPHGFLASSSGPFLSSGKNFT